MNEKHEQTVERFIELRAEGWTFARLSEELQVSKPTLIAWSRKHQHRIQNLQVVHWEALAERCKLTRQHSLETIAEDEQRLRDELVRRDLKDLPTFRLFQLLSSLRKEATSLAGPVRLVEPVPPDSPIADHIPTPVVSWHS